MNAPHLQHVSNYTNSRGLHVTSPHALAFANTVVNSTSDKRGAKEQKTKITVIQHRRREDKLPWQAASSESETCLPTTSIGWDSYLVSNTTTILPQRPGGTHRWPCPLPRGLCWSLGKTTKLGNSESWGEQHTCATGIKSGCPLVEAPSFTTAWHVPGKRCRCGELHTHFLPLLQGAHR